MDDRPVLVVIEIMTVRDEERLSRYQSVVRDQIFRYGGIVVARGGVHVEGPADHGRLMIQKWPSEAAFRAWQSSDEYRPHRAARREFMDIRICAVELLPQVVVSFKHD